MSLLSTIINELTKPDAQKGDWYAWTTNQMSHVLLGVIGVLFFSIPTVILTAISLELIDLFKKPTRAMIKDSLIDIYFWTLGCFLILYPYTSVVLLFFSLLVGIISRYRKLLI